MLVPLADWLYCLQTDRRTTYSKCRASHFRDLAGKLLLHTWGWKSRVGFWKGFLRGKYSACKYHILNTYQLNGWVVWFQKIKSLTKKSFHFILIFKDQSFFSKLQSTCTVVYVRDVFSRWTGVAIIENLLHAKHSADSNAELLYQLEFGVVILVLQMRK